MVTAQFKFIILYILVFVFGTNAHAIATNNCVSLFISDKEAILARAHKFLTLQLPEVFALRPSEMKSIKYDLESAIIYEADLSQNYLVQKSLQATITLLTSKKFRDGTKERLRSDLIEKIMLLIESKQLTLTEYMKLAFDFLQMHPGTVDISAESIAEIFNAQVVRDFLLNTGFVMLPLNINQGYFPIPELNSMWAAGILPLGLSLSPFKKFNFRYIFYRHDRIHALGRVKKMLFSTRDQIQAQATATFGIYEALYHLALENPRHAEYLHELFYFYTHEPPTGELSRLIQLVHSDLLRYGGLAIDYNFLKKVRQSADSTLAAITAEAAKRELLEAARRLINNLYSLRTEPTNDLFEAKHFRSALAKISPEQLAEIIWLLSENDTTTFKRPQ